jgi:hypothetical protein
VTALSLRKASIRWTKGNNMSGTGRKGDNPDRKDGKPNKPPLPPVENDDDEDGDIASPKRDSHGDDDEPL